MFYTLIFNVDGRQVILRHVKMSVVLEIERVAEIDRCIPEKAE